METEISGQTCDTLHFSLLRSSVSSGSVVYLQINVFCLD